MHFRTTRVNIAQLNCCKLWNNMLFRTSNKPEGIYSPRAFGRLNNRSNNVHLGHVSGLMPTNISFDGISDRSGAGIEFENLPTDTRFVEQAGESFSDIGVSNLVVELSWPE